MSFFELLLCHVTDKNVGLLVEYLLKYYESSPSPYIEGYKVVWVKSYKLRPGYWDYEERSIEDSVFDGIPIQDGMAEWDCFYEDWVPLVLVGGNIQRSYSYFHDSLIPLNVTVQLIERDSDYMNYMYKLVQRLVPLVVKLK